MFRQLAAILAGGIAFGACTGDPVRLHDAEGGVAGIANDGGDSTTGDRGGTGQAGSRTGIGGVEPGTGGADHGGGAGGGSAGLGGGTDASPSGGSTGASPSTAAAGGAAGALAGGGGGGTTAGEAGSAGAVECVADLSTNAAHCGRCGHSCGLGAACRGGLCLPVTVLDERGYIMSQSGLLLDGSRLYFSLYDEQYGGSQTVGFVSSTGGGLTVLSAEDEAAGVNAQALISLLALDDQNAYWFSYWPDDREHMRLRAAPKDGTGAAATIGLISRPEVADKPYPVGMVVDQDYVYWLSEDDGLYRFAKSGPVDALPELLLALPGESTEKLVLDSGWLYWASTVNGQIWRYALSDAPGGVPSLVDATSGGAQVCGLHVDAPMGMLFWAECGSPFNVWRAGIDGTGSELLASPVTDAAESYGEGGGVVVDEEYAYFLGRTRLHRVPKTGGQPEAIGDLDWTADRLIGVDDRNVYLWATELPTVLRLAK
jgi:hypothetical protein